MSIFEEICLFLNAKMEEPKAFGWFHLMWLGFVAVSIILLYKAKNKHSDKQLKVILGTYGIIALVLEIIKQILYTFDFDAATNTVTWDYQWYAFPFQFCSTPIFVTIICLFLNKNKIRDSLLSYIAFATIWGSIMTMLMPDSCLVPTIMVNIHTMWLHFGSFVVSVYLIMSGEVFLDKKSIKGSILTFIIFVAIANILNVGIYNTGILNGETFNMFYISPYFESTLPVFDIVWRTTPYFVFLFFYTAAIILGIFAIYGVSYLIKKIVSKEWAFNKRQKDYIKN